MTRRKSVKANKTKKITPNENGEESLTTASSAIESAQTAAETPSTESAAVAVSEMTIMANGVDGTISAYIDYDPSTFSPLFLYRPQNDVVGSLIVHSSSEGAGRYELGRKIGINTKAKTGNRRVSHSIQLVTKHFPDHIGQYQKMEGKYRTIKYFFKAASKPQTEMASMNRFKELTHRDCPFKFGDVLKFPNSKLNTLRISDITMKRFLYILESLQATPIILTSAKVVKIIQARDTAEGYPFRIDKRSAAKCLLALSQHGFCRVFTTEYEDEGVSRAFEVVTAPIYAAVEHPDIQKAIHDAAEQYALQQKIFPTGTMRPWRKADATPAAAPTLPGFEAEEMDSDDCVRRDVKHANHLREVLRTRNEVPMVSEKTLNNLAISYRRRRGLVASVKRAKIGSQPDTTVTLQASGDEPSTSSGAAATTASEFFAANRDLAEVMASSSLETIKDELVNVLVGGNSTTSSSTATSASTPSRRRKPAAIASAAEATPKKKKRLLDDVDINCLNQQIYMRNRFTAKERDMLILIRAVGFFLNPVHRFWLDPTVMRDVMHEYVPESRCKTANSLLAAGSRDLARNERMAHLQYIVKTLSSFEEMRELRNKLPSINMDNLEEKNAAFVEAFATAYELLFKDSQVFPSIEDSDADFDAYITSQNLHIAPCRNDDLLSMSDYPRRSLNPLNERDAKHCVNFNVIMSVLLNDDNGSKSFLTDHALKTVASQALEEGLEQLYRDGLVSKVRSADRLANIANEGAECDWTDPLRILRNQVNLSVFYRHFFYHSYRNDVMSATKAATERFRAETVDETFRSDPGSIQLLSRCLMSDEFDIDFDVPESVEDLFSAVDDQEDRLKNPPIKRMRELEDADLHIERMRIRPIGVRPARVGVDATKAIASLTHKVPVVEIERAQSRDCTAAVGGLEAGYREDATLVYQAIESSDVRGLTEEELIANTKLDAMQLKRIINLMTDSYDIFPCGIDKRRYVLMRNADCWMVRNERIGFFPRPWSTSDGESNVTILKWMAESILVLIHKKPGILISELISSYAFVIQPIIVEEILCLLEIMDASHIHIRTLLSLAKTSDDHRSKCTIRYAMPEHDGLEKFAECFRDYVV